MNRILVITAFCAGLAQFCPAHAQRVWHPGEATLFTGVILRGELSYQPEANAILVRREGTLHAYTASQLQSFSFVNGETFTRHHFGIYTVSPNGRNDEVALIFEKLTPVIAILLLQLPGNQAARVSRKYGLPQSRKWPTPQPWYVWYDGQFIAPDVFVETEIDVLLATSPEAVQRWGASYPKPANPKELGMWLARYSGQMRLAKPKENRKLITRAGPY